MMFRLDLHTHSQASPDGSLRIEDYRQALNTNLLQAIAVTDHNSVALALQAREALGPGIIVGEEIATTQGELIGLYLSEEIPAGLSTRQTAERIHQQGGLVYVPHAFETVRKGLAAAVLDDLAGMIDIMEIWNGRAWLQNQSQQATEWSLAHGVAQAASSDTHGRRGWGKTYSEVAAMPEAKTLVALLKKSQHQTGSVGVIGALYPTINRWGRIWRHT